MKSKLKTYGVEGYYNSPRAYINGKWVPYEVETLVVNDEIVSVSYFDKDAMPPKRKEYDDKETYLKPEEFELGEVVRIKIKTPGKDDCTLDLDAEYIGTKEGIKDCTVYGAKDFFSIRVLTAYFRLRHETVKS